jgi:hypothetical protein
VRELAKSFNSFSWALSLLGAQQVLNLVRRPLAGTRDASAAGLDSVTRVTEGQLGGILRNAFEAGEQVQRSAVDLAFGVMTLEALDPNRFVALSTDVVRQSTVALRRLLPGGTPATAGCGCSQPCGWGPMPPAR